MPAVAKIAFLPDADGRLLVFVSHDPPDAGRDTARLIRPGESFLGLSFEQLAVAGSGRIIPDGKGGGRIEVPGTTGRQNDQRRR
jgi:hypothetical protein